MTYRVEGFNEVHKSNIRLQVVLVAGVKSRFDDKLAILASYTRWGAKLCGAYV